LDALLGGGLDMGTSTLIIGPAGTGKSTLSAHFAAAMAKAGGKASIFTFDESSAMLTRRADALGLNLSKLVQDGLIYVDQVDPASLSPGELAWKIKCRVMGEGVKVVIIDSLNGYLNASPSEKFLSVHLHELLTFLGHQGVATILTVAQQGPVGQIYGPVDVTYLADTVLLMRFFEFAGSIRKAVSVTKKRSGRPECTIRELRIMDDGIVVGDPLTQFQGILSGAPTFYGSAEQMLPSPDEQSGSKH
jgi:circadian clock protein KaiC